MTAGPLRIASLGHAAFAAVLIGLGILGFVTGDFTPVWAPVPKWAPGREALIYACAAISLGSGLLLMIRRTAAMAARALLAWLVIWIALFRAPYLVLAPGQQDSWSGCGETMVITAAAWVLYAWFADAGDKRRLPFPAGETGLTIARVLYGLAMLPFGEAHFFYFKETAALVPSWLPAHEVWAASTGSAFIVAGLAVTAGVYARLAAALSTLQMGLFTVLVWLPIMAAPGPKSAFQWSETILSVALTAAGWVVADSYRDRGWFAARAGPLRSTGARDSL